jgi:hypothetical protein
MNGVPGASSDFFEPVIGWRIWRRSAKRHVTSGAAVAQAAAAHASSSGAPDYTDPVVGWRIWRVLRCNGQYVLGSLFNNVAWFPETRLDARCFQAIRVRSHESPDPKCRCGIYAAHHDALDWGALSHRSLKRLVIGRVLLWGTVIEAEHGWRATHAYPERIFVPRVRGTFSDEEYRIADGLGAYGVPVARVHVESVDALLPTLAALAGAPSVSAA